MGGHFHKMSNLWGSNWDEVGVRLQNLLSFRKMATSPATPSQVIKDVQGIETVFKIKAKLLVTNFSLISM